MRRRSSGPIGLAPESSTPICPPILTPTRGSASRVKLLGTDVCPECDGSGAVRATDADLCPDCLGSGRPKQRSLVSDARLLRVEGCSTCRGTGRVQTEPCPACGGDGELATVRTVEVDVPPGTV